MRKVVRLERRRGGSQQWKITTWYLLGFIPIYQSEIIIYQA